MTDIFREVDEDLRHEQYKRLWDRFGPYVIGLAVLIVALTAGWRLWEYWQLRSAQATGDRFVAALELADKGKHDEAIAALDQIAADGSGRYPVLADFRVASEKADAGDLKGAVAAFDALAASSSTPDMIKPIARLRAALLLVDTASLADLEARIGDLAKTGEPWRHSAREILGLAAWRAGDLDTARKYYEEITADQEKPADLETRAQFMLALIKARAGEAPAKAAGSGGAG
jgi:hypothetical protein